MASRVPFRPFLDIWYASYDFGSAWNSKTSLLQSIYWNIEWFLPDLTFYPPIKASIRVEKHFFKIVHKEYQKKRNFKLVLKKVRMLNDGKNIFLSKKRLQKTVLGWKFFGEFIDAWVRTFFNHRKDVVLFVPFAENFKKKYVQLL